jgi:hypothetical protein
MAGAVRRAGGRGLSQPDAPPPPPAGWVVGVLVRRDGEAVRLFYALGHAERAKAEWTAVDRAQEEGEVATSPRGGMEPVEALAGLTAPRMAKLGLAKGEVRALGDRWPRRWLS